MGTVARGRRRKVQRCGGTALSTPPVAFPASCCRTAVAVAKRARRSPRTRHRVLLVVGQRVAQPVVVVRGMLEKLRETVRWDHAFALQRSRDALPCPVEGQGSDDGAFRITEPIGELVSDEQSRKPVGQIGQRLPFSRIRHIRDFRNGLNQPVRHCYGLSVRRRLAQICGFVHLFRLGTGGIENRFGYPYHVRVDYG